ncbi:MAG: DoxX family protein [Bacteroidetes bacterium]|nr:DoxX family protein [Bacteroidota bacterium]
MKKIFSITPADIPVDLALLILRVVISLFMAYHGLNKMTHFSEMQYKFMDFLGLGGSISLCLTIFAEFFCSIFLIVGLATRLVLIPLIITMLVAVIVAHKGEILGDGQLGTIYLLIYLTLYIAGPGRYSLDAAFAPKTS